jgi:hypothetical protein
VRQLDPKLLKGLVCEVTVGVGVSKSSELPGTGRHSLATLRSAAVQVDCIPDPPITFANMSP